MTLITELHHLAASQHGVVSRTQLLLLGFNSDMIRHHLRSGHLTLDTPRVVGIPGAPMTAARRAMAAVLDAGPGALLSGTSAMTMWDVPGYVAEPFHVLQPRGGIRPRNPVSRVHLSRIIPPHHVKVVDGIPLTSPTRTVFDLAGMETISSAKLARTIDTAWANASRPGRCCTTCSKRCGAEVVLASRACENCSRCAAVTTCPRRARSNAAFINS